MIVRDSAQYYDLTITTASGTGTANLEPYGMIESIAVIAPAGNPQFNIDITDKDGYGVWAASEIMCVNGKATIEVGKRTHLKSVFQLSAATVNGVYQLRIWVKNSL